MSSRTNWPKVAVYLLLEKDDKVMLIRRYKTGWHDGDYSLPAGHVKSDESIYQAMIRETNEEVNITISKKDLQLAHVIHRNKTSDNAEYIDFYFKVKTYKGKIKKGISCDKIIWRKLSNLPSNIIPVVKHVLEQINSRKIFSVTGWD